MLLAAALAIEVAAAVTLLNARAEEALATGRVHWPELAVPPSHGAKGGDAATPLLANRLLLLRTIAACICGADAEHTRTVT